MLSTFSIQQIRILLLYTYISKASSLLHIASVKVQAFIP